MTNKFIDGLSALLSTVGNVSAQINSNGETVVYADCLRDLQRAQIVAIHRAGREFSTADAAVTSVLESVARLSSAAQPSWGHALGLVSAALVLADHLQPEEVAEKENAEPATPELSNAQLRKIVSELADKIATGRSEGAVGAPKSGENRESLQAELTRQPSPENAMLQAEREAQKLRDDTLTGRLERSLSEVVGAAKANPLRPVAPGPTTPSEAPGVGAGRLSGGR